jgi:hypothetical protein
MTPRNASQSCTRRPAIILMAAVLSSSLLLTGGCHKKSLPAIATPADAAVKSVEERWKDAAAKVEEPRQGAVGLHSSVDIPVELTHSSDRHRFLALQVAEWRKQGMELPEDFAGLASLIQKGEMVEMPLVGSDYVLFGVGGIARDGPLTYYDREDGESVPIYSSDDEFQKADGDMAADAAKMRDSIAALRGELGRTKGRERGRRAVLLRQIGSEQAQLDSTVAEGEELISYYRNGQRREAISAEYKTLSELASNFAGTAYDLSDPAARRAFKTRLLSFLRPQAKAVLEEIAGAYSKQFGRPLPVTSLVRTEEYQHQLSETNPNAARNAAPPHTTGLAFDIYYHFMDADEQTFLMNEIAKLKQGGKVEALRETRDHFHVFAFADGQPPPENLVADSMAELAAKARDRVVSGKRPLGAGNRSRRTRGHRA